MNTLTTNPSAAQSMARYTIAERVQEAEVRRVARSVRDERRAEREAHLAARHPGLELRHHLPGDVVALLDIHLVGREARQDRHLRAPGEQHEQQNEFSHRGERRATEKVRSACAAAATFST